MPRTWEGEETGWLKRHSEVRCHPLYFPTLGLYILIVKLCVSVGWHTIGSCDAVWCPLAAGMWGVSRGKWPLMIVVKRQYLGVGYHLHPTTVGNLHSHSLSPVVLHIRQPGYVNQLPYGSRIWWERSRHPLDLYCNAITRYHNQISQTPAELDGRVTFGIAQ